MEMTTSPPPTAADPIANLWNDPSAFLKPDVALEIEPRLDVLALAPREIGARLVERLLTLTLRRLGLLVEGRVALRVAILELLHEDVVHRRRGWLGGLVRQREAGEEGEDGAEQDGRGLHQIGSPGPVPISSGVT